MNKRPSGGVRKLRGDRLARRAFHAESAKVLEDPSAKHGPRLQRSRPGQRERRLPLCLQVAAAERQNALNLAAVTATTCPLRSPAIPC